MSVRVYIFYFITIVTDGYISEWYTWTSHPALGRPIPTYIPSPYGLEFLSSVNNKEQEPRALVIKNGMKPFKNVAKLTLTSTKRTLC